MKRNHDSCYTSNDELSSPTSPIKKLISLPIFCNNVTIVPEKRNTISTPTINLPKIISSVPRTSLSIEPPKIILDKENTPVSSSFLPYKCNHCHFRTSRQNTLTRHVLYGHGNTSCKNMLNLESIKLPELLDTEVKLPEIKIDVLKDKHDQTKYQEDMLKMLDGLQPTTDICVPAQPGLTIEISEPILISSDEESERPLLINPSPETKNKSPTTDIDEQNATAISVLTKAVTMNEKEIRTLKNRLSSNILKQKLLKSKQIKLPEPEKVGPPVMFECDECNFTTSLRRGLVTHAKTQQSDGTIFTCLYECGFKACNMHILTRHEMTHGKILSTKENCDTVNRFTGAVTRAKFRRKVYFDKHNDTWYDFDGEATTADEVNNNDLKSYSAVDVDDYYPPTPEPKLSDAEEEQFSIKNEVFESACQSSKEI